MASVVAARDEKKKERRDASVNLRARPRASSVLPRAPVRAELSLEKLVFKIKSRLWLAVGQAVGISRQISQLAPLCGPSQDRRTQSANGKRTSLPAGLGRQTGWCFANLAVSAAVSARAAFYRRFALKSVRLRRPRPQPGTPRSGSWPCTLVRHRPLSSKANVRRFTRHPPCLLYTSPSPRD